MRMKLRNDWVESKAVRALLGLPLALVLALAACGGGGENSAAPLAVSAPGTVSINADSNIESVTFGNAEQAIYVMPGDLRLATLQISATAVDQTFDVSVALGGDVMSPVTGTSELAFQIDATALKAGNIRNYKLTITNRVSGGLAQITGQVRVLTPREAGRAQIGTDGGTLLSSDGAIRVDFSAGAGSSPLTATLLVADSPDGDREFRLDFDQDISNDTRSITFATEVPAEPEASSQVLAPARIKAQAIGSDGGYPNKQWATMNGTFIGTYRIDGIPILLSGVNRLRFCNSVLSRDDFLAANPGLARSRFCVTREPSWALASSADEFLENRTVNPDLANRTPVLFVHGFSIQPPPKPTLGGGENTWDNFPALVNALTLGEGMSPLVFEFRWKTNAKFETVADNLAMAINRIHRRTGKKVTIVAHSFGGLLARTMLQGFGSQRMNPSDKVQQLITLGTPHSGISVSDGVSDGSIGLPIGSDLPELARCAQISCWQAGLTNQTLANLKSFLGEGETQPGSVVFRLANSPLPSGVSVAVGIGLALDPAELTGQSGNAGSTPQFVGSRYRSGDGLISLAGQRVHPVLSAKGVDSLKNCEPLSDPAMGGGLVKEVILGSDDRRPGDELLPPAKRLGYNHTSAFLVDRGKPRNFYEAAVDEICPLVSDPVTLVPDPSSAAISCNHASFALVRSALQLPGGVCGSQTPATVAPTISAGPQSTSVVSGQPAAFTVAASGANLSYEWRKGDTTSSVPAPGATDSATYNIASASLADSGGIYFVIVRNSAGSAASNGATLTVTASAVAPAITVQPRDVSVNVGQSAIFSLTATGTNPSYEWRKGNATSSVAAPGATSSPTYSAPPATPADSGSTYFAIVRNSAGSATSSVASLTVLVATSNITQMALTATPDPVQPGQLVQYAATVSNRGTVAQYYNISAQVPNNTTVAWDNISKGGLVVRCAEVSNITCAAGKTIQWGLGIGYPIIIGAGQSFTVSFGALVDTASPPANGTVIRATAMATTVSGTGGGTGAALDVAIGP